MVKDTKPVSFTFFCIPDFVCLKQLIGFTCDALLSEYSASFRHVRVVDLVNLKFTIVLNITTSMVFLWAPIFLITRWEVERV